MVQEKIKEPEHKERVVESSILSVLEKTGLG
jgi:hypothetical protein